MHTLLAAVMDFLVNLSTLANNVHANAPRALTITEAYVQVVAAMAAESPKVKAELLLGMAYVESRYQEDAVSMVKDGARTGGIPKWDTPPDNVRGPFFCGVTQVAAGMSWNKCVEFRNVFKAYRTAVKELELWLKQCDNDMDCALSGYSGGFPAIKAGTTTYPYRVQSRARLIDPTLS